MIEDNICRGFAVRVEPDGDSYLFRPRPTTPGVRLTAVQVFHKWRSERG